MRTRTARSQVSGLGSQETNDGEMKLILFFPRPETCSPETYFIRAANSPNSGNSKRSPCHAFSDRTIHKNNMASEARIPKSRKTMAAATFEKRSARMVKTKKAPQSNTLCQAWKRTKRLLRKAGKNKSAA